MSDYEDCPAAYAPSDFEYLILNVSDQLEIRCVRAKIPPRRSNWLRRDVLHSDPLRCICPHALNPNSLPNPKHHAVHHHGDPGGTCTAQSTSCGRDDGAVVEYSSIAKSPGLFNLFNKYK
jgi:hypothetical protein